MVHGKCFAIRGVGGMRLIQQNFMMSISVRLLPLRCHQVIRIGFFWENLTAAAVAAGVLNPSVAGATQSPGPASLLVGLTSVVDKHLTNVESSEMSSFLGELRNVLGN